MDPIDGQQQRRMALVARSPACVLFLASTAFGIAELSGRQAPVYASFLLLFLLPLPWALAVPRTRIRDGLLEAWTVIAVAWLAWMAALQLVNPSALPIGWWRIAERTVPLAACLTVATAAVCSREMLRLLGVSAACTLMIATVMNAQEGRLNPLMTESWGLGHINFLVNTAAPSLLAWSVLLLNDRVLRARRQDLLVLAGGFIALTVTAVGTGRRGIVLAFAAVLGWFALLWVWRRSRPFAIALALSVIGGGAYVILGILGQEMAIARSDRLMYYGAALDGVRESFPWGYGHFGAMRLQEAVGERARHLVASGGFAAHAHNEFLDALIDGGPVALACLMGLLGLLALRVRTIGDPALRHAFSALGICIGVHLFTDNCYGTPVGGAWCGVVAGLVLAAPTVGPGWVARGWLPPVAFCLWPLALVATWGAIHTIPSAMITPTAPTAARIAHARRALEPQAVYQQAVFTLGEGRPPVSIADARTIIDLTVAKIGWTGRLPNLAVRLAQAEGSPLRQAEALIRVLRLRPFDRLSYQRLAEVARLDAAADAAIGAELRHRLAVISGRIAADSDLAAGVPADIESAVCQYVAIIGAITRKMEWEGLRGALGGLVARYGDIPGVAQLAVEAICQAPEATFPDLVPQGAILAWGLRFQGLGNVVASLATTPAAARAALPLLSAVYPTVIARCAKGTSASPGEISDEHMRVIRTWSLARAGSAVP
jgi:hypothetical protein